MDGFLKDEYFIILPIWEQKSKQQFSLSKYMEHNLDFFKGLSSDWQNLYKKALPFGENLFEQNSKA